MENLTKEQKYFALKLNHKDTVAEELFKALLDKYNIEYEEEVILGRYRADFIINSYIYEIIGGYHNTPHQRKKDKSRAEYLLKHFGLEIKEIENERVLDCFKGNVTIWQLLEKDNRSIKEKILVNKKIIKKVKPEKSKYDEKANECKRKKWKEMYQLKKRKNERTR